MSTGELQGRIDCVWDSFWSGGISNPIEVIEQITYLIFQRRLDDIQTRAESRARRLNQPLKGGVFPAGKEHLRWSRLKNDGPDVMFQVMSTEVFPFSASWAARGRRTGTT